jgi:hypothetical protein
MLKTISLPTDKSGPRGDNPARDDGCSRKFLWKRTGCSSVRVANLNPGSAILAETAGSA